MARQKNIVPLHIIEKRHFRSQPFLPIDKQPIKLVFKKTLFSEKSSMFASTFGEGGFCSSSPSLTDGPIASSTPRNATQPLKGSSQDSSHMSSQMSTQKSSQKPSAASIKSSPQDSSKPCNSLQLKGTKNLLEHWLICFVDSADNNNNNCKSGDESEQDSCVLCTTSFSIALKLVAYPCAHIFCNVSLKERKAELIEILGLLYTPRKRCL